MYLELLPAATAWATTSTLPFVCSINHCTGGGEDIDDGCSPRDADAPRSPALECVHCSDVVASCIARATDRIRQCISPLGYTEETGLNPQ